MNEGLSEKLPLSGGTLTGPLILSGPPTADLNPTSKKYVDDSFLNVKTLLYDSGNLHADSQTSETMELQNGKTFNIDCGYAMFLGTISGNFDIVGRNQGGNESKTGYICLEINGAIAINQPYTIKTSNSDNHEMLGNVIYSRHVLTPVINYYNLNFQKTSLGNEQCICTEYKSTANSASSMYLSKATKQGHTSNFVIHSTVSTANNFTTNTARIVFYFSDTWAFDLANIDVRVRLYGVHALDESYK